VDDYGEIRRITHIYFVYQLFQSSSESIFSSFTLFFLLGEGKDMTVLNVSLLMAIKIFLRYVMLWLGSQLLNGFPNGSSLLISKTQFLSCHKRLLLILRHVGTFLFLVSGIFIQQQWWKVMAFLFSAALLLSADLVLPSFCGFVPETPHFAILSQNGVEMELLMECVIVLVSVVTSSLSGWILETWGIHTLIYSAFVLSEIANAVLLLL
jgi:hypothetical protein